MAFCIQPQYERNYDPPTYPPSAVIVNGDWKLIRFYADNPDRTDRTELYNLKDDIGETFDLSAALPDIKSQLSKQLDDYIAHIQVVMPAPNPNYNPAILPPPVKRLPSDPYTPPYGD
jgi:arylsulfatase A-like enzyme